MQSAIRDTELPAGRLSPIVCLDRQCPVQLDKGILASRPVESFPDFRAFQSSGLTPAAFLLRHRESGLLHDELLKIRRSPEHATALIFVDDSVQDTAVELHDGVIPCDAQQLADRIEETQARAEVISRTRQDADTSGRLFEYMWLRPGFELKPKSDPGHFKRYRYPLLEALDLTGVEASSCIRQLEEQGYLERAGLVDRQRECDHCGSAHLNFVDVCPSCKGIDMDQHSALHCFTCGLVAPEMRFMQAGERACPKCGTRLLHIGSDYDRPVETCMCNDCEHVFVEGQVVARCMHCNHTADTDRLRLHKIYSWRLSQHGNLAAQGKALPQAADVNHLHYATADQFLHALDWMLQLVKKQPRMKFEVAAVKLENLEELNQSLGYQHTATLLDAFADRLRERLDAADVSMRIGQELLLLLLPCGDKSSVTGLRKTLKELMQMAQPGDARPGPRCCVSAYKLSAAEAGKTDARKLFDRLLASVGGAAAATGSAQ